MHSHHPSLNMIVLTGIATYRHGWPMDRLGEKAGSLSIYPMHACLPPLHPAHHSFPPPSSIYGQSSLHYTWNTWPASPALHISSSPSLQLLISWFLHFSSSQALHLFKWSSLHISCSPALGTAMYYLVIKVPYLSLANLWLFLLDAPSSSRSAKVCLPFCNKNPCETVNISRVQE